MINMATAEPSRLKRIYHVQEAGSQRSTSSSRHRKRQLCDVMRIPLWTSPRRKCNIYHQPVYRPVKWKSLEVLARTPDGSVRRLLGESHMDVWELVSPLVEEFDIQELKVNMADTGVPVDLTASAALLENDAITVEDAEFKRDSRSATDARLALVEDILYSEKEYCHTLKSVCDLYEKPLRKFLSLDNKDYRAFFDWVEPLCSLSKLVINKLENALEFWDPDHTKIGSIFSKQLWNKYEEYQCIFRNTTLPLLREKEEIDEDFVALCQLRQGAAKCSLDDLLRLPLDRLAQYEQYLSQLAEQTSEDHPDITDTYRAASKAKKMVKRTEAAKEETDLDRIQDLFPNDNLRLHDRDPLSPKKNLLRTKSAAAYKLQKALPGKSKMFPNDPYRSPQKNDNNTPQRRPSRSECVRNFIMEGAVQFTVGVQSQDRHLFLFNDLLIVAKPRSGGTYRLKEKVLVCEMWSSTCVEDVSEISLKRETSFVLGWPTVNVAVTFSSPHTKQLWEERLKQLISESKDKEGRTVTSIQFSLCNQSTRENTSSHYITLKTNNRQTAKDCIKLLLEQLGQSGTGDFQLWIKSNKDDAPYPLIGHEYPFCIKMSFIRGLLQRSDLDLRNFNNISTDTKCTFILRRKSQKATAYTSSQFSKKQKKQRRTTLISWPFKRNNNIKQDSLDSGHSSPPPGNLFGQDLGKLCTNKSIPSPIMAILTQLFQKGPFTVGIFRKSANARSCRELKEKLEANPDCDLRDVSVLVLASVLKEFLRSLPDCLLLSSLYHQWLDVVESQWAFREKVLRLINQLPSANFNVLQHLLCVLWHISQRASENKMSATNLAVCIGPSLLTSPFEPTPQSSNSQQQEVTKKVPKLVAYLIENCRDIFGEHCIHLFGEVPERDQSRQDSGAEESDSFHSLQDIGGNYRRDDSSIDSLERDYLDDGEHSPKLPSEAKMSLTNLSRDSGLTLSDTQLYTPEDEMENELTQDGEALRNKTAMLPFTKSTPHLEMTGIENNHQSCGIHGRTSGVSIDGSCNDVVKKRRHGMDCRQKPCAGNLFISSKGKNQYNDGNTHSSLLPSLSYSYGMDTGKLQCSDNEQANSSTYADIKHRKVRGRSLVRQPVISAMESREITMPIIRRSASEESLHQICIPQDSAHQHLTNKYRTPSPPYQRVTVLSSSAPDFHRDRHAIWFANQNRCVDWKRSQSTSKIDEIDYCHNNGSVSVVSSGSSTPHVSRSNSRSQDFGARSHGDIYSLYSNPKRVSSVCSSSSEASQRSHHSHISHGSNKSKRSINSQTSGGSQGSVTRIHPDSSKPCEPPSYQETINRQTLLRGIQSPSASPVDEPREEQSNLSAKARQLYENSIRMYSQKPNSTVETHHAVPVNIVNSDERISKAPPVPAKPHTPLQWTSSENASHRLRHHPPVHIKDSQISRQPNYQAKKGVSVVTYYKQRDREDLPEDWRKEINWSVAQLRSIFTSQQSSCQASNSQKSQTYHRSLANNWTANGTEKPCCQNETITSEEESLV